MARGVVRLRERKGRQHRRFFRRQYFFEAAELSSTEPGYLFDGEYLYLRVREQNGQDNPIGDGDDEVDNETGEDRADGFRDDLNDSAWTTPVWFSKVR